MALYNTTRYLQGLLKEYEDAPPSFTVRLYREHWILNNSTKFLYNNQMASVLDDIRSQHIPVDFLDVFDGFQLPYYEGCLIVELLDYRPAKSNEPELEQPEKTRVVLTPTDESRWADLRLISAKSGGLWSDAEALQVEARLLLATAPPLCLEPDVHLTRIVNATQRVSTPPVPLPLKRKAAALDQEADDLEKARRLKLMQFMGPQRNVTQGKFSILDAIQRVKQNKVNAPVAPGQAMPVAAMSASPHANAGPTPVPTAPPVVAQTAPPTTAPAPTPTPVPAQAPTPVPPSSTPVPPQQFHPPPTAASSPAPTAVSPPMPVQNIKKAPLKKKADTQPPLVPRTSATPAPGPSSTPLAVPQRMQHYPPPPGGRVTPMPAQAPSPRATPVAHASSPQAAPEQRPPSVVPPPPSQPVQHVPVTQTHVQRPLQPSPAPPTPAHPQVPQQPPMQGGYPPQMANPAYLTLAAGRGRGKPGPPGAPNAQATPQGQAQMTYYQQQLLYQQRLNQQQQQQQAAVAAAAAAGSPATQSRSPMPNPQAQAAAAAAAVPRNSPMVQAAQLATRSPMPNHAQVQQQQQQQQQQQTQQVHGQGQQPAPPQHSQHSQHHTPGQHVLQQGQGQPQPATQAQAQQYYAAAHQAFLRQMQQHPQIAAAVAAQAQGGMQQTPQQQAQAQAMNPQMMAQYWARMGMPMAQVPPQAYWGMPPSGAGRGMPPQQMPGMPGHPQQMQPGAGGKPPGQGGQQ